MPVYKGKEYKYTKKGREKLKLAKQKDKKKVKT